MNHIFGYLLFEMPSEGIETQSFANKVAESRLSGARVNNIF